MKFRTILTLFATAVFSMVSLNAIAAKQVYTLKSTPAFSSKLSPVIITSPIPFDKRYVELSDEQQALFAGSFKTVFSDDTPPFPSAGLQAIYKPLVNNIGRGSLQRGHLSLSALVNEYGVVQSIAVVESTNSAMAQEAIKVLKSTHFDPAKCGDNACAMVFPLDFEFE